MKCKVQKWVRYNQQRWEISDTGRESSKPLLPGLWTRSQSKFAVWGITEYFGRGHCQARTNMVKQKIGYCQSSKTKGLPRLRFESFYVCLFTRSRQAKYGYLWIRQQSVTIFLVMSEMRWGHTYTGLPIQVTQVRQSKGASIDMTWRQCYIHPDLHLMTGQVQSSHWGPCVQNQRN